MFPALAIHMCYPSLSTISTPQPHCSSIIWNLEEIMVASTFLSSTFALLFPHVQLQILTMDFLPGRLLSHPAAWLDPRSPFTPFWRFLSPFSCLSLLLGSSFLPLGPPSPRWCCSFKAAGLPAELASSQQLKRACSPESAPSSCFLGLPTTSPTLPHQPAVLNQTGLLENLLFQTAWGLKVHSPSLTHHHHRHQHTSQLSMSRLWVLKCHSSLRGS